MLQCQYAPVQTRCHNCDRLRHPVRDAFKLIFCRLRKHIVLFIQNKVCVFFPFYLQCLTNFLASLEVILVSTLTNFFGDNMTSLIPTTWLFLNSYPI